MYTAENLIKIAELDVSNLTDDQLRKVLASINDAAAIRNSHFYLLYEGEGVLNVNELKPRAEGAAADIKTQNRQLIRNIINVASLTNDRLNSLNRVNRTNSFYSGVASGDDDLNYGAWIKGFVGKETDKASVGSGSNSNTSRSKSNIHGFVIGADVTPDGRQYCHTLVPSYRYRVRFCQDSMGRVIARTAAVDPVPKKPMTSMPTTMSW